jgi:hypothetical protein
MANRYYRRKVALAVGGFRKDLHVMENLDILWKIEKAGYKEGNGESVVFLHHRPAYRFKTRFILNNAFTYGYHWNKLSKLHPEKIGISKMPVKLAAFIVFAFLSFFFLPLFWILLAVTLFWFGYHFYRDKRVKNCLYHMDTIVEKIGAIIFGFSLHVLFEVSQELGKLYAILT